MLRRPLIRVAVDVELARQEWEEGHRRVLAAQSDPAMHARLVTEVEVVLAEIRRRIGQTFTLGQLAEAYAGADPWVLAALHEALLDRAPAEIATVAGAAFHSYSRRALDYTP